MVGCRLKTNIEGNWPWSRPFIFWDWEKRWLECAQIEFFVGEGRENVSNRTELSNLFHNKTFIENDRIWDKWMRLFTAKGHDFKGF